MIKNELPWSEHIPKYGQTPPIVIVINSTDQDQEYLGIKTRYGSTESLKEVKKMENRIGKLEASVINIDKNITDIKSDIKGINTRMWTLSGAFIVAAAGSLWASFGHLDGKIDNVRLELKSDIRETKLELKSDINEIRDEIRKLSERIK